MILDPQNMFYTWSGVFWAMPMGISTAIKTALKVNQSIKVYFSKQPLGIFQSRKASRATDKFLHNKLSGNKNNRRCTITAQRDAGERLARHHTAKQPDTRSQYRLGPRQHTRTPKQPQRSHCPRGGQAVAHKADTTRQRRCPPRCNNWQL